jgi:VIT1/CCC1 family predicted Fe2+/Mn2+ transporter
MDNLPEVEKQEMVDIYMGKGFSEEDSQRVVELLWNSKRVFLDVMMVEELGIMPKDEEGGAIKGALITFASFVLLGGFPMIPYLISGKYHTVGKADGVFAAAVVLFAVALFILGAFRVFSIFI